MFDHRPHKAFACFFLNVWYRLIIWEELFRGALTEARVYPHEIARHALYHNAAAVALIHNRPAGNIGPSKSDIILTRELRHTLTMLDMVILDHMTVGRNHIYGFLEHGRM